MAGPEVPPTMSSTTIQGMRPLLYPSSSFSGQEASSMMRANGTKDSMNPAQFQSISPYPCQPSVSYDPPRPSSKSKVKKMKEKKQSKTKEVPSSLSTSFSMVQPNQSNETSMNTNPKVQHTPFTRLNEDRTKAMLSEATINTTSQVLISEREKMNNRKRRTTKDKKKADAPADPSQSRNQKKGNSAPLNDPAHGDADSVPPSGSNTRKEKESLASRNTHCNSPVPSSLQKHVSSNSYQSPTPMILLNGTNSNSFPAYSCSYVPSTPQPDPNAYAMSSLPVQNGMNKGMSVYTPSTPILTPLALSANNNGTGVMAQQQKNGAASLVQTQNPGLSTPLIPFSSPFMQASSYGGYPTYISSIMSPALSNSSYNSVYQPANYPTQAVNGPHSKAATQEHPTNAETLGSMKEVNQNSVNAIFRSVNGATNMFPSPAFSGLNLSVYGDESIQYKLSSNSYRTTPLLLERSTVSNHYFHPPVVSQIPAAHLHLTSNSEESNATNRRQNPEVSSSGRSKRSAGASTNHVYTSFKEIHVKNNNITTDDNQQ